MEEKATSRTGAAGASAEKKSPGPRSRATGARHASARSAAKPEGQAFESKPSSEARAKAAPRMERTAAAKGANGETIQAEVLSPSGETAAGRAVRLGQARTLVDRKVKWATLGGAVPIPLVDVAAITGVQLSMLAGLSEIYGRPFDENAARAIVTSLLGGFLPYAAGLGLGGAVAKAVPLLGWGVGIATVSLLGRAFTRALGRLFILHFESGGAVLDFDPEAMREHFRVEFNRAKAGQ